jgi:hypothetical protein
MSGFKNVQRMQAVIEEVEKIKDYIRDHTAIAEIKMREVAEQYEYDFSMVHSLIYDENFYSNYQTKVINNW